MLNLIQHLVQIPGQARNDVKILHHLYFENDFAFQILLLLIKEERIDTILTSAFRVNMKVQHINMYLYTGNQVLMKKINWKEVAKFLSGAFFVTAGASWYFAYYMVDVPFMGTTMTHRFLAVRGFLHFALFLLTFYYGFIRR